MKEITFELTNFCEHGCQFCSSEATSVMQKAVFLPYTKFHDILVAGAPYDRVILSGGEPLAHPEFYAILRAAEFHSEDVVVYSNAIRHLAYNARVIDGVRVEANLSLPENVERLHVLKRVPQGREATRPEVKLSRNWATLEKFYKDALDNIDLAPHLQAIMEYQEKYAEAFGCHRECDHIVVRPDGTQGRPCKKETKTKKEYRGWQWGTQAKFRNVQTGAVIEAILACNDADLPSGLEVKAGYWWVQNEAGGQRMIEDSEFRAEWTPVDELGTQLLEYWDKKL
jgi:organic radical activating enzyme